MTPSEYAGFVGILLSVGLTALVFLMVVLATKKFFPYWKNKEVLEEEQFERLRDALLMEDAHQRGMVVESSREDSRKSDIPPKSS